MFRKIRNVVMNVTTFCAVAGLALIVSANPSDSASLLDVVATYLVMIVPSAVLGFVSYRLYLMEQRDKAWDEYVKLRKYHKYVR